VPAARIRRLNLVGFRNYRAASLTTGADLVVLTGPNGAGKTNVLEAISFLSPGRGLRRARLDEVATRDSGTPTPAGSSNRSYAVSAWAVSAEVDGALGLVNLGTGIEPSSPGADETGPSDGPSRICRIDREPVRSAAAFADHLRVVWLVPAMDALFIGPAAERRRFLDRLVLAVDPAHGARVAGLERALRSRNRLLEKRPLENRELAKQESDRWLEAAEHQAAELAVAVAAARAETVQRLAVAIAARPPAQAFPSADIAVEGWLESMVLSHPAIVAEDRYRAVLRHNRDRDAAAGRTLEGPHLSDLVVRYREKGLAAGDASTGEQKALLIGLVLAHAALVATMTGTAPVILLDEVAAHLDPARRNALYDSLEEIGAQVWMTGADPAVFAEVARRADIFDVRTLDTERPHERP
jgi:DNA replication and repair protein RecF